MLEKVRKFYPNAVASSDFVLNIYKNLAGHNLAPSQIMLAHSICSDDVNSIEYPEEGREMLGPFNLGGLNGYPFTGLTGMSAFAHHVPKDGAAMIFYAPHIGVSNSGELGKIIRVGQHEESSCCGAAALALSRLKNNEITWGEKPADDYQQHTLQEFLYNRKDRVLSAEYPIKEATEVILEQSGMLIDRLIQQTGFTGKYLFVVGAVIINTDWQYGSFLEMRRFEEWDIQTKIKIRDYIA
ncbi:hypothetical protein [Dyadobacter fanqingshengii]|uniref:Limiting CO2-inducible protein B/C beta carbonyic anhydrase domain-containing protein n=1 Tax=Dyadobacter fanqingshengii TaxID=2906443 RepID=A0A9X1P914_9BACT|nr:hypothetical protein [Dyadobacter fanqingshengii]MCF0040914.1 hypothetical protein [Dyadobacter fanqingshengii]USJ37354.1 hypothetical protein NFI81_06135 [Dyadobacter fanqingshengii]